MISPRRKHQKKKKKVTIKTQQTFDSVEYRIDQGKRANSVRDWREIQKDTRDLMGLVHSCNVAAHRIIRKNKDSILLEEVEPASYTTDPVAASEVTMHHTTLLFSN